MPGLLQQFLQQDHARLSALLERADCPSSTLDRSAYESFRRGLIHHIAMEEKVLFPESRRLRGGQPFPIEKRLRADHGDLVALLVPPPDRDLMAQIRSVLEDHNRLEEGPDGLYAECECLFGTETAAIVERLREVPEVQVAPHFDGPRVRDHIATLLRARTAR